jgi:hypothetical protein
MPSFFTCWLHTHRQQSVESFTCFKKMMACFWNLTVNLHTHINYSNINTTSSCCSSWGGLPNFTQKSRQTASCRVAHVSSPFYQDTRSWGCGPILIFWCLHSLCHKTMKLPAPFTIWPHNHSQGIRSLDKLLNLRPVLLSLQILSTSTSTNIFLILWCR